MDTQLPWYGSCPMNASDGNQPQYICLSSCCCWHTYWHVKGLKCIYSDVDNGSFWMQTCTLEKWMSVISKHSHILIVCLMFRGKRILIRTNIWHGFKLCCSTSCFSTATICSVQSFHSHIQRPQKQTPTKVNNKGSAVQLASFRQRHTSAAGCTSLMSVSPFAAWFL